MPEPKPDQLVPNPQSLPTDLAPAEETALAPKSAASQLGRPTKAKLPSPGDLSPKKTTNKLYLAIILVGIVMLLVILILYILGNRNNQPRPSNDPRLRPTPTLVPRPTLPTPQVGRPSKYSEDPEILQLEAAIKSFSAQIDTVNLSESELDPPQLETKVKF